MQTPTAGDIAWGSCTDVNSSPRSLLKRRGTAGATWLPCKNRHRTLEVYLLLAPVASACLKQAPKMMALAFAFPSVAAQPKRAAQRASRKQVGLMPRMLIGQACSSPQTFAAMHSPERDKPGLSQPSTAAL